VAARTYGIPRRTLKRHIDSLSTVVSWSYVRPCDVMCNPMDHVTVCGTRNSGRKHLKSSSFIVLAVSSDDGQQWPKHVKTKLALISIKLIALDGLPLLIYNDSCLF
jgi:hypothetical protein